jgi:hypothetical protein
LTSCCSPPPSVPSRKGTGEQDKCKETTAKKEKGGGGGTTTFVPSTAQQQKQRDVFEEAYLSKHVSPQEMQEDPMMQMLTSLSNAQYQMFLPNFHPLVDYAQEFFEERTLLRYGMRSTVNTVP